MDECAKQECEEEDVADAILAQARKPRPEPKPLAIPAPPAMPNADDDDQKLAKSCPCKKESSESSASKSESSEESSGASASGGAPCVCEEFDAVTLDLKKLKKLTKKILKTESLYDAQTQWLDAAQMGITKMDRQIEQAEATKADLDSELKQLRKEKKEIMNKAASAQISRDMRKAMTDLAKVTMEHERIQNEKEELSEASSSLTKTILTLRKRLSSATQTIKTIKKLPKIK